MSKDGKISIHALVKRATDYSLCVAGSGIISIHALVKRATYFNVCFVLFVGISIHALVKRATGGFSNSDSKTSTISIHALVKRATIPALDVSLISFYFNPRPRKEGDLSL